MVAHSQNKDALGPSRLRERRRKARFYKFVALGFVVFCTVGLCVGFFYIPQLRISGVTVSGTKTLDPKDIELVMRKSLSEKLAYVIPKNNAFIYSDEELISSVTQVHPKVKNLTIELKNFHEIEVLVEERIPVALWCGEYKDETQNCLYLDESGVVFEEAPEYSGDAYIRWYGAMPAQDLGASYIPESFPSLYALVSELEKEELHTQEVIVEKNGDVEVLYRGDFTLRFTAEEKPEAILTALRAAERSDVLKNRKLTDLQYLDMRFLGSRLYYKFK